jgi:hypothetical protein
VWRDNRGRGPIIPRLSGLIHRLPQHGGLGANLRTCANLVRGAGNRSYVIEMRLQSFIGKTLAVAVSLVSAPSRASVTERIPSALVIAKSSNKNQVHYAVEVDESCAPVGPAPVSPYWLMLERGPHVTEPLGPSEQHVLGVEREVMVPDGVQIVLRGFPARVLTIHIERGADGTCASSVDTTIAGVPAKVASVYVQERFLGVAYVLLTGVAPNGAVVQERVRP